MLDIVGITLVAFCAVMGVTNVIKGTRKKDPGIIMVGVLWFYGITGVALIMRLLTSLGGVE